MLEKDMKCCCTIKISEYFLERLKNFNEIKYSIMKAYRLVIL